MIEAAKHLSKTALSYPLDDLVPEVQVVMNITNVLPFVVVKPIIFDPVWVLKCCPFPLKHIDVVNQVFFKNLLFLALEQVLAQMDEHLPWFHRKLNLELIALALVMQLVGT